VLNDISLISWKENYLDHDVIYSTLLEIEIQ